MSLEILFIPKIYNEWIFSVEEVVIDVDGALTPDETLTPDVGLAAERPLSAEGPAVPVRVLAVEEDDVPEQVQHLV